jgi:DNA-binding transcriptional LysR family regulator
VRVSASPAVAVRLIAPYVADFHRACPGITLVLSGATHHAALDRGEADLAVRLSRPLEPDLVAQRIGVIRFALYATPEHAALPAEQQAFIGYDAVLEHVTQQVWLRSLLAGRPVVFQASDLFGQQEAARAGLGAVVLPCFMGDDDAALVRMPTPSTPPTREIWLVTYPDLKRSPAIRTVMKFLADVVGRGCPVKPGR